MSEQEQAELLEQRLEMSRVRRHCMLTLEMRRQTSTLTLAELLRVPCTVNNNNNNCSNARALIPLHSDADMPHRIVAGGNQMELPINGGSCVRIYRESTSVSHLSLTLSEWAYVCVCVFCLATRRVRMWAARFMLKQFHIALALRCIKAIGLSFTSSHLKIHKSIGN